MFAPRGLRCLRPYLIVTELAVAAAAESATVTDLRVFKRVIRGAAKNDRRLVARWRQRLESRPFPGGEILERELFRDFERTLDVGWFPDHGVFVEVDTYETHGNRVSFERDHKQRAGLIARGLQLFAVTTNRMRSEPALVAAELEATLAHAQAAWQLQRNRG